MSLIDFLNIFPGMMVLGGDMMIDFLNILVKRKKLPVIELIIRGLSLLTYVA